MKIYAAEAGFISRLISDRRDIMAFARELKSADAMRAAREDLMASALIFQASDITEKNKGYTIDADGAAHIPIVGELTPRAQTDACGAYTAEALTEYGFIIAATSLADADPMVSKIIYNINSPGGYVDGVDEAAQAMAGAKKPTESRVTGRATSAAYWLASMTDKIIAMSPYSTSGSIGVAAEEYDDDRRLANAGIDHRVYTSTDAPDKRPDTATDEGRAKIVAQLDALHAVFVSRVAEGRHTTPEHVSANFGRGGVLTAESALKAGMIDEIRGKSIARNVPSVAQDEEINMENPGVAGVGRTAANIEGKEGPMDLATLKADHPDAYQEAHAEGRAAEKKRRDELSAFLGINAEGDKIVNEALASGADYASLSAKLTAATVRGSASTDGDNPPAVTSPAPASSGGVSEFTPEEVAAYKKAGISLDVARKYAPKDKEE